MDFLIIAVLGLLVLTKLYKFDKVSSIRHFRLAWSCMIASVAITAVGQLLTITSNRSGRTEIALLTNTVVLAALAVSLYFWNKAVGADTSKTADNSKASDVP